MPCKKRYYAIKKGKGVKNLIVTSWEKCSGLVAESDAVYKSFHSMESALSYLKTNKK